jgi:hypothetical protein
LPGRAVAVAEPGASGPTRHRTSPRSTLLRPAYGVPGNGRSSCSSLRGAAADVLAKRAGSGQTSGPGSTNTMPSPAKEMAPSNNKKKEHKNFGRVCVGHTHAPPSPVVERCPWLEGWGHGGQAWP